MSEKEFGKALLRGEEQINVQMLTERVVRRDRLRMWILGIVCVIAWMAVVMLPWATILPMLAKVVQHQSEMNQGVISATAQQLEVTNVLEAVKVGTIATFISSMASMFVAALCTVLLIILSRRATLRQINARLAEISSQLKAMGRGN
jgi:ABC-type Fe3+ transport system permease subunit